MVIMRMIIIVKIIIKKINIRKNYNFNEIITIILLLMTMVMMIRCLPEKRDSSEAGNIWTPQHGMNRG